MEEQMLHGVDTRDALKAALNEVVLPMDWADGDEGTPSEGASEEVREFVAELNEASREAVEEPWQISVNDESDDGDADDNPFERGQRHPLHQRATILLTAFFKIADRGAERPPNIDTLVRSAMEVSGGLAQVLPMLPAYDMDDSQAGLGLVQLKRALRGAAFVRGSLFLLRSEHVIAEEELRQFIDDVEVISVQVIDLLRAIREARDIVFIAASRPAQGRVAPSPAPHKR